MWNILLKSIIIPLSGVMISLFALIAGEFVFDPQSGHSKENKIPICCFSAKYAALMSKSKD